MTGVEIKFPSITENIRIVEGFIERAKEAYALDDDVYGNILIAVTEAVNNAIIHGNKLDIEKDVILDVSSTKHVVTFTITDQGEGFDPHNLKDPTSPENIDQLGGRGIYLIKNLADDYQYLEEGRCLKLSFYV